METKTIQLEIPEYLTIRQYMDMVKESGIESKIQKNLHIISSITGISKDELQYWDLESLKEVAELLTNLGEPNGEFHSIIEWNGTLYGYSDIKQQNLGQYIDIENLCKDIDNNLHKIAACLYRPITDHKFNSTKFILKNSIKVLVEKDVVNVFDYYNIERYDSEIRKKREDEFLNFPVSIALGAISFFLVNASQYLNNIAFSQILTKKKLKQMNQTLLESLTLNTGAGGGLSILSPKVEYLQLQETKQ